jgi:hypothetical protein
MLRRRQTTAHSPVRQRYAYPAAARLDFQPCRLGTADQAAGRLASPPAPECAWPRWHAQRAAHPDPQRRNAANRGWAWGSPPARYRPRHPSQGVLYRCVQEHFETWLTHCREGHDDARQVPTCVEREFRRYLELRRARANGRSREISAATPKGGCLSGPVHETWATSISARLSTVAVRPTADIARSRNRAMKPMEAAVQIAAT